MQSRALCQVLSHPVIVFGLVTSPAYFVCFALVKVGTHRVSTGCNLERCSATGSSRHRVLRLPRRISLTFFRFSSHTEVCRTTVALLPAKSFQSGPSISSMKSRNVGTWVSRIGLSPIKNNCTTRSSVTTRSCIVLVCYSSIPRNGRVCGITTSAPAARVRCYLLSVTHFLGIA